MVDQPLSPPKPRSKVKGTLSLPPTDPGMNKRKVINAPPDQKGAEKDTSPEVKPKSSKADDEKILDRIRKRMERCISNEAMLRKAGVDDLKFLNGDQWPADVATQRATDKRPCLTANRLPIFVSPGDELGP